MYTAIRGDRSTAHVHTYLPPFSLTPPPQPTPPFANRFAQGYFLKDAAAGPDNARCLDGSPALYYHRKGTGSGANKWYVHQEGGGWCYDLPGCVSRSKGRLGSTLKDTNTSSLTGGYWSLDETVNPLMYNWNSVCIGRNPPLSNQESARGHLRGGGDAIHQYPLDAVARCFC